MYNHIKSNSGKLLYSSNKNNALLSGLQANNLLCIAALDVPKILAQAEAERQRLEQAAEEKICEALNCDRDPFTQTRAETVSNWHC
jgi:hypothetical protein